MSGHQLQTYHRRSRIGPGPIVRYTRGPPVARGILEFVRLIVIILLFLILASLGSALVFLFRGSGDSTRTAKALTIRIALSVGLFLLLMAGFYFGLIPPGGI